MNTMNNIINRLKTQPKHGVIPRVSGTTATSRTTISGTITDPINTTTPTQTDISDQVMQLARQMADEIVADQQQSQLFTRNGRVFTRFDQVNDVISNQTEVVTSGLWSDNLASLTTYFTSSTQTTTQRQYYVDLLQSDPAADGSAVQFSIAYGHALGSGSSAAGQLNDSPSRAIYSQYRRLLLQPTDTRFTTAGSGSTDYVYIINFKRNRLKERLDAGNFELPLCNITSRATNATGSVSVGSTVVTLIDDSKIANASIGSSGKVYNIVSGSLTDGVYNTAAPVYYGLAYPDHGVLVLDGKMLDQQLGFTTNNSSNVEANNHFALYRSISGSALQTNPSTSSPYGFLARNSEKITSTHYFVRIKNAEYNFSNNPSYVTGSVGQIAQTSFIGDPKTYITTVGLYNDSQELLAIAKLSKPLLKSFQRESLIRVKLDF